MMSNMRNAASMMALDPSFARMLNDDDHGSSFGGDVPFEAGPKGSATMPTVQQPTSATPKVRTTRPVKRSARVPVVGNADTRAFETPQDSANASMAALLGQDPAAAPQDGGAVVMPTAPPPDALPAGGLGALAALVAAKKKAQAPSMSALEAAAKGAK